MSTRGWNKQKAATLRRTVATALWAVNANELFTMVETAHRGWLQWPLVARQVRAIDLNRPGGSVNRPYLIIAGHLRRRLARFELSAHLFQPGRKRFDLPLLLRELGLKVFL
jgi:hypothetical protein